MWEVRRKTPRSTGRGAILKIFDTEEEVKAFLVKTLESLDQRHVAVELSKNGLLLKYTPFGKPSVLLEGAQNQYDMAALARGNMETKKDEPGRDHET